jgi:HEAT repeat protein
MKLHSKLSIALLAGALALGPATARLSGAALLAADDPSRSTEYRNGQRALSEERWSEALAIFTALADAKTSEADAALYWRAWTENKLGRRADALTTLRQLENSYPKSEWVDDAQALELELQGPAGAQRVLSVGAGSAVGGGSGSGAAARDDEDEDLKLYALDGLMQAEPERAVPILERFLAGDHSLKLKERALFVLAQSETPRARQILVELVRSGNPPELRLKAVEQLGIAGGKDDLAALQSIWNDSSLEVKRKVLEAWMVAGQSEPVIEVARTEKDPQLRRKAIETLGVMGATEALGQLYATERDVAVRAKLLEAYGVAGDIGALSRAAHGETDVELRRKAIEGLGVFGGKEGSNELVGLYGSETEPTLRRKIVEALMVNGDSKALIALFRQEKDPAMKRDILQKLSLMNDDEVEKLLSDVLEERP